MVYRNNTIHAGIETQDSNTSPVSVWVDGVVSGRKEDATVSGVLKAALTAHSVIACTTSMGCAATHQCDGGTLSSPYGSPRTLLDKLLSLLRSTRIAGATKIVSSAWSLVVPLTSRPGNIRTWITAHTLFRNPKMVRNNDHPSTSLLSQSLCLGLTPTVRGVI